MSRELLLFFAQTSSDASIFSPAYIGGSVILGGIVGALIGMTRGRTILGLILGALLGCIGWIIILVIGKKDR